MNIKIDPEFHSLIPALTQEEYEKLEKSIQEEGCRDALVLWDDGTILDGHNRYEICQRHERHYKTITKSFESRDEAKQWVIRNQLGRRNLSPMDRVDLALLLKPIIEEQAKEKQKESGGAVIQKSGKPPVRTDKEVAKIAEVSHDTVHKVMVIKEEASPEQITEIKTKKKSINKVYGEIKKKRAPKPKAQDSKENKGKARDVNHKEEGVMEKPEEEIRTDKNFISPDIVVLFKALEKGIKKVKKEGWRTTSRNAIRHRLQWLETITMSQ